MITFCQKRIVVFLLLVLAAVAIVACSQNQEIAKQTQEGQSKNGAPGTADNAGSPKNLTIMGGAATGAVSDYVMNALAKALEIDFPETNVRKMPGGTVQIAQAVNKGDVDVGFSTPTVSYNAFNGIKPFEEKLQNIRYLGTVAVPTDFSIVTRKNSNIKSFKDLAKKRIGLGSQTSITGTWARHAFEAIGVTFEDIKRNGGSVMFGEWSDQFRMLQDGQLDAVVSTVNHPSPLISEFIAATGGFKMVPIDKEVLDYVIKKNPGLIIGNIKAGTYEGQSDYVTLTTLLNFLVPKDMPDQVAYNITKALFKRENQEEVWKKTREDWKKLEFRENARLGVSIPLHPGAEKYYNEQSIKVKDSL